MQLRELAMLNGTFREGEFGPRCSNCGATTHKAWQCPDTPNVTNTVICNNCGGTGHIAKDCRTPRSYNNDGASANKIDEEVFFFFTLLHVFFLFPFKLLFLDLVPVVDG